MRRSQQLILNTVAAAGIANVSARVLLWRARDCTAGRGYVLVILA